MDIILHRLHKGIFRFLRFNLLSICTDLIFGLLPYRKKTPMPDTILILYGYFLENVSIHFHLFKSLFNIYFFSIKSENRDREKHTQCTAKNRHKNQLQPPRQSEQVRAIETLRCKSKLKKLTVCSTQTSKLARVFVYCIYASHTHIHTYKHNTHAVCVWQTGKAINFTKYAERSFCFVLP